MSISAISVYDDYRGKSGTQMEISPQQLLSEAIYILDFQNSNTGPEEEKQDFVFIVVEDLPLVRNLLLL